MTESKEIDYHRYWKDRAERAEAEIENVKKEADQLMMNKIAKYEKQLDELRKEIEYLKKEMTIAREEHEFDNMVHRKEMDDMVNKMRKDGIL